jgi:ATP-dependent Lon protease
MEIIEITGYTTEEKIQIAQKYLIPKQLENHGLKPKDLKLADSVIEYMITHYTRESGVRGLDKQVAAVVRYIAKERVMNGKNTKLQITNEVISKVLGVQRVEPEMYQNNDEAGVVTGLAWTSVGGEILFVESRLTRGNGKLTLTGQLGDVMKESAVTALTYLKSHAADLQIDPRVFDKWDVHVHVPAGAVPKDGPSAGITMLTSLASVFTQRKVKSNLAMTGEITLRGKVLPIGGVKEKILAAKRAGITDIIMCEQNRKDVADIKAHYLEGLNMHYVSNMQQVLDIALLDTKVMHPIDLNAALKEVAKEN